MADTKKHNGLFDCAIDQLGGVRTIKASGKGRKNEIILGPLKARDEKSPELFTVCFSTVKLSDISEDSNHRVIGEILWGSYSGKNEALFDIRHGTRVTLEGTHVRVGASIVGAGGPSLDIYSSVSYGSIGKDPPLTFTEDLVRLDEEGAVSPFIEIPKFAHSLSTYSNRNPHSIVPAPYVIEFSRDGFGVYYRVDGTEAPALIAEGTEFVRFTIPGAGVQNLVPVFNLTL